MIGRSLAACAALLLSFLTGTAPATADVCRTFDDSSGVVDNELFVGMTCNEQEDNGPSGVDPVTTDAVNQFEQYVWLSVCQRFGMSSPSTGPVDCTAARSCADPLERVWALWGRLPSGRWEPLGTQCFGRPPTVADTPQPTVTPALVLTALRRMGLPAVVAQTQPEGKTLVNFDTIFYAEPQRFITTVTLLGQRVDVEADPAQFTWQHGDGTSTSTQTPGAPYPAKDITHEYTDAHQTVEPRVDVTYVARFRVNGGAWQDISETITIPGPTSSLRISEATAVLSGQYQ